VKPDVAVGLGGKEAGEHALDRGAGEVFHLVPFAFARLAHDGGQGEHAEAHVPRLVLQDAAADLREQRVDCALLHHPEHGHREGLGHELQRDGLDVPAGVREDRVEDEALVLRHRVVEAAQAVLDVALEHLVVAGLVGDLGGLEELGVSPFTVSTSWLHARRAPCSPYTSTERRQAVMRRLSSTRSFSVSRSQMGLPWMSTSSSARTRPSAGSGASHLMSRLAFH
jgi:hypothetical protein